MPFDITAVIVQGLPECLVFVFLVYSLLGIRASLSRILVVGSLYLSLLVIVRSLGAPIPAHTLVALVMMSIIVSLWESIPLLKVILSWGAAVVLLIVSETSISLLAALVLGVSLEELVADYIVWALVGLPHIVVMALLAWWIHRRGGIRPFKALPK